MFCDLYGSHRGGADKALSRKDIHYVAGHRIPPRKRGCYQIAPDCTGTKNNNHSCAVTESPSPNAHILFLPLGLPFHLERTGDAFSTGATSLFSPKKLFVRVSYLVNSNVEPRSSVSVAVAPKLRPECRARTRRQAKPTSNTARASSITRSYMQRSAGPSSRLQVARGWRRCGPRVESPFALESFQFRPERRNGRTRRLRRRCCLLVANQGLAEKETGFIRALSSSTVLAQICWDLPSPLAATIVPDLVPRTRVGHPPQDFP